MVVKWPEVAAVKAKEPKEPIAKPVTGDLDERLLAPVNSELRRNITAARVCVNCRSVIGLFFILSSYIIFFSSA